jgi:hypothetical protein
MSFVFTVAPEPAAGGEALTLAAVFGLPDDPPAPAAKDAAR